MGIFCNAINEADRNILRMALILGAFAEEADVDCISIIDPSADLSMHQSRDCV